MEKETKKEVYTSEVVMVEKEDSPVYIRFTQRIKGSVRLGKEVKISPKTNACLNEKGYKVEYFTETVSVCIGIGKDYTAELIMTEEAWRALKRGDKVFITTTKQFKELYG